MNTENKEQKPSNTDKVGVSFNPLLSDDCIKFRKVRVKSGFNTSYSWRGRKKNFCFELSLVRERNNCYYATVTHSKKDIRFNSLCSNITFANIQDGFDWCERFESKNFSCLGADII